MVMGTKMETASMTAQEHTMATTRAELITQGPGPRIARHNVAVRILARQTTVQLNAGVQILKRRTAGNALSTPELRLPNR